MKRFLLALLLFGTALAAHAALWLRSAATLPEAKGFSTVVLGERSLMVPQAMIRDHAQWGGGRLERLDLAMNAADFSPLPPLRADSPDRQTSERLSLTLTQADATPDTFSLFQTVYARFLSAETLASPGGLAMRRFRPGTPYEDREIYIGAGARQPFVALCPREAHLREIEPCTTLLRRDGLNIEMRFQARHLPEWRNLLAGTLTLVGQLTAGP